MHGQQNVKIRFTPEQILGKLKEKYGKVNSTCLHSWGGGGKQDPLEWSTQSKLGLYELNREHNSIQLSNLMYVVQEMGIWSSGGR